MRKISALCFLLAAPLPALAQDNRIPPPSASAQGDVAITIYNNDLALVQDERRLTFGQGRVRQEFPDVSARIRPETVSLAGADLAIVEQNFDFDLLSPQALIQKAVGETITLVRTNPATGAETRERATVLAANGGVVLQIGDRIEVLRDDGLPVRVIFDRVPENLRARPTLSVTVDSRRAGPRPVTLTYLTHGLNWSADYVALFDERAGRIDVQGWITLVNNSGTEYRNAETLLVAGGVGGDPNNRNGRRAQPIRRPGTETADRERVGDLYLYPLRERTTIANRQTKQVSFLDVSGAAAQRTYEYTNGWLNASDEPESVSTVLRFSSSRDQGLGDALPAGTIRVYQRDQRGNPQFVGENQIGHTPMGSDIGLTTGEAFDVRVQPTVVQRHQITEQEWQTTARFRITNPDGTVTRGEGDTLRTQVFWQTQMRYTLTNARPEPVTVIVTQDGLNRDWNDTRIVSETLRSERPNADRAVWRVAVPANGTATLEAVYQTRY